MPGEDLAYQYERRFRANAEYRDAVWSLIVPLTLQTWIPSSATVLDLGCGWGEFSNHVGADRRIAMDLNGAVAQYLAEGIEFVEQDCTEPWPIDSDSLDVVFSSNFLEHLKDKEAIERTLIQVERCLKPGGRAIFMGPNVRLVGGEYWDFWDHFVPISDRSLVEVLPLTGLDPIHVVDRYLPYSMSSGRNPPLFLVSRYLKTPALWRFFGKQFLVVAEKRSESGVR